MWLPPGLLLNGHVNCNSLNLVRVAISLKVPQVGAASQLKLETFDTVVIFLLRSAK